MSSPNSRYRRGTWVRMPLGWQPRTARRVVCYGRASDDGRELVLLEDFSNGYQHLAWWLATDWERLPASPARKVAP